MNRFASIAATAYVLLLLQSSFPVPGGQALAQSAQSEITERLQTALDATVASAETQFPGAILYVSHPRQGTWVGAAGVADIETGTPLGPDAKFRAGSIMKPFIATVVLQLVEEGRLSLDDAMTELLPGDVTSRFSNSDRITLRMLLNHTSGIPEWVSGPVIERIVANPGKVWDVAEYFDLAAAQPATFAPGEGWSYSNTDYNLLGVIIERATGQSWRDAVIERVIEPLGLANTSLPEPGNVGIEGAFMHGYRLVGDDVVDLSFVDPSMAGAAGGGALVTTVTDLAAFMAALRAGELFEDPRTFAEMADFVDAPDTGGLVGYGLGFQKYLLPGGVEMVGHLGGTGGYRSGTFYFPVLDLSMTFALSAQSDPTQVIITALQVLAPGAVEEGSAQGEITEIPPVIDVDGYVVPGSLASLEKVTLGGVDQWILIRAQDPTKPVLLVLHGGPGAPMTPWVDVFQPLALEENFVVVHWDQRGAGKSFDPGLRPEDLKIENFVGDTLELTNLLRERFSQDKIFLTGISWGSALGFVTLMENSDPFHAFIAAAERVHWQRSQTLGFEWVKERAEEQNDTPILEAIAAIEPFDAGNLEHLGAKNQGLDRYRGGDFYTEGLWDSYLEYAIGGQSPYYTAADIQNFIPGSKFSLASVIPQALDYDLFRDFPSSTIPIHFLVGDHDWQTPGELSHEYFEVLEAPAKSFTVIENAGHSLIYDNPDAWAAALIRIAEETLGK